MDRDEPPDFATREELAAAVAGMALALELVVDALTARDPGLDVAVRERLEAGRSKIEPGGPLDRDDPKTWMVSVLAHLQDRLERRSRPSGAKRQG